MDSWNSCNRLLEFTFVFLNNNNLDSGFLRNYRNYIYYNFDFYVSNVDAYMILLKIIPIYHEYYNKEQLGGSNPMFAKYNDTSFTIKINVFQFILDLLGMMPAFTTFPDSSVFDFLNFLLSTFRGNYTDAFFSLIAMIPTGGLIAIPIKYVLKVLYNNDAYFRYMQSNRDEQKSLTVHKRNKTIEKTLNPKFRCRDLEIDNLLKDTSIDDNYTIQCVLDNTLNLDKHTIKELKGKINNKHIQHHRLHNKKTPTEINPYANYKVDSKDAYDEI